MTLILFLGLQVDKVFQFCVMTQYSEFDF